jgi:hypothetical protein
MAHDSKAGALKLLEASFCPLQNIVSADRGQLYGSRPERCNKENGLRYAPKEGTIGLIPTFSVGREGPGEKARPTTGY